MGQMICPSCKMERHVTQFQVRRTGEMRYKKCADCRKAEWRQWYERNAQRRRLYMRRYRKEHPVQIAEYKREYRKRERDKNKEE